MIMWLQLASDHYVFVPEGRTATREDSEHFWSLRNVNTHDPHAWEIVSPPAQGAVSHPMFRRFSLRDALDITERFIDHHRTHHVVHYATNGTEDR
jgi:hypothetical protein